MLYSLWLSVFLSFFFFNDPATTEIYTLSLHDALPISCLVIRGMVHTGRHTRLCDSVLSGSDRKSTRLNSSHSSISYAVFCLKKKKDHIVTDLPPLLLHADSTEQHIPADFAYAFYNSST